MHGCRVCGAPGPLDSLVVREMMFGTREAFVYESCGACASLQIQAVPKDLSPYYPAHYPAHAPASRAGRAQLRRFFGALRDATIFFAPGPLLRLAQSLPGRGDAVRTHPLAPLRGRLRSRKARIADVGGGSGWLLVALRHLGFTDLTCIDPYLRPGVGEAGVRFLAQRIADIDETFDVIMYHHALEHVVDLDAELRAVARHLAAGGAALVRAPLLPNAAFETYGAYWAQIDAPRHIHVPSRSGLEMAAARHRLEIVARGDDSTAFQFWASEGYARGIPLLEQTVSGRPTIISRKHLDVFTERARHLNVAGRGDQGWFVFRRISRA